jgi:hypothetical protein
MLTGFWPTACPLWVAIAASSSVPIPVPTVALRPREDRPVAVASVQSEKYHTFVSPVFRSRAGGPNGHPMCAPGDPWGPGLLFEPAFHVNFERFRRNKPTIFSLAVPGVIAATALTTVILTPVSDAMDYVQNFNWCSARSCRPNTLIIRA